MNHGGDQEPTETEPAARLSASLRMLGLAAGVIVGMVVGVRVAYTPRRWVASGAPVRRVREEPHA